MSVFLGQHKPILPFLRLSCPLEPSGWESMLQRPRKMCQLVPSDRRVAEDDEVQEESCRYNGMQFGLPDVAVSSLQSPCALNASWAWREVEIPCKICYVV